MNYHRSLLSYIGICLLIAVLFIYNSRVHADIATSKIACDAGQSQVIAGAIAKAKEGMLASIKMLENTSNNAVDRYVMWFGAPSSSSVAEVKAVYVKALGYVGLTEYWCPIANSAELQWSINESAAAYPGNAPTAIYFAPFFFQKNNVGPDSKAGTIIHELTHLSVVRGTEDHSYGMADSKRLAKTAPARARNNADSYKYFMEDVLFGI